MSNDQKYALLTGSSSGIGLATIELLLEKNFIIFGGSRNENEINHENFIDLELDVRDEKSVNEFFKEIATHTSVLNLVINNAGICEMSPIHETSSEQFLNHFETNTLGVFHILKGCGEFLIANETHIINILSTAAKHAYPNVSAYCSSKYAMLGLVNSIQKEWQKKSVRFTNLFPGAINTALWDKVGAEFSREKMLVIDEFIYVMNMVIDSPEQMQFPDITFLHRDGFID